MPRRIGLHAVASALGGVVEDIDKRDRFSTFGIDHTTYQALRRERESGEEQEEEEEQGVLHEGR